MDKCLQKTPSDRISTNELLRDKFIAKAVDRNYLVDNFISGIEPIASRQDEALMSMAEEWKRN